MEPASAPDFRRNATLTVYPILFATSIGHLLNDSMQSTVTALFPVLKDELLLSYAQIGMIALAMNLTASLLQPLIGRLSDTRPMPRLLPIGVCFTLVGIIALALAPTYPLILAAVVSIGIGSAIFHPETSRVAYLAAGSRRGLAQSVFQVGGNIGHATGPVMTAVLFARIGQGGVMWLAIAAAAAVVLQTRVAKWYGGQLTWLASRQETSVSGSEGAIENVSGRDSGGVTGGTSQGDMHQGDTRSADRRVLWAIVILVVLVISKNVYVAGMTSYYTFYMIESFGVSISQSQWFLFAFLLSSALGTLIGGPLADRFGRRKLIWFSILGAAPFALLVPYGNLVWSGVLASVAGFIMASAFSIIVVYGQELLPDKIGLVSGLFFGLAFGVGGLGSALLGRIADQSSIMTVMVIISFLPLLGMLTVWLPNDKKLGNSES